MEQVKLRYPQLNGTAIMRTAQVMSRKGNTLRVKVEGEFKIREVDAADTVPCKQAYGRLGERPSSEPQKQFPTSSCALANMV